MKPTKNTLPLNEKLGMKNCLHHFAALEIDQTKGALEISNYWFEVVCLESAIFIQGNPQKTLSFLCCQRLTWRWKLLKEKRQFPFGNMIVSNWATLSREKWFPEKIVPEWHYGWYLYAWEVAQITVICVIYSCEEVMLVINGGVYSGNATN